MRAFTAIEVPSEFYEEIKKLQDQLPKEDCKLTKPKEFHITLQFLGEIDEDYVDEIKKKFSEINFIKFGLTINNLGVFPDEKYIKVVWIGFKDDSKVNDLVKLINEKLDFKSDKRFHAHITLARVKFVKDKEEFIAKIKQIKIPEMNFKVDKVKLIKSELTPEGPVYSDLGEFGLEK